MILLHLLEEEDKYGYQLSQDLEKQSEGEYQLNEATMYPTLYRLKKNGFLEERKVQSRKAFSCILPPDRVRKAAFGGDQGSV